VLRTAGAATFAGNDVPPGAEPLAQAYAGHQFGHFTNLGDGRAILLGEQIAPDGRRFDIQLKGSGRTPYSRNGDGRAALGPMLREFLISEGMHALGIPTTRSLAIATTGEAVLRERALPGAVLTRVAASHIRVGTFEYAAAVGDRDLLVALLDHVIARHYPEIAEASDKAAAFLEAVVERQASLIAKWMLVGFVHGVMNTDNMAVSGETIDYGPCAFLDVYDPATTFSSIDRDGRYAYANQPGIAHWNLARLAESLLPLIQGDEPTALDTARGVLATFPERFGRHYLAGARAKLGLATEEQGDADLFASVLRWMHETRADFTQTFADLPSLAAPWHAPWQARLAREPGNPAEIAARMRRVNPRVIPRNHRVEESLVAAEAGDLAPFERLVTAIRQPFAETTDTEPYRTGPPTGCGPYRTFCGT
ncbi:MAG: protein adenylyltransferase SelO, partial [Planctomycetia bacterium]